MKKGCVAILSTVLGAVAGAATSKVISDKTINQKAEKVDKFKSYYNMLNQWLLIKQEGKSLESWFIENEYKTVAIYGMGEMGNRLYDELNNTSINVKYGIDKNAGATYSDLEVCSLDDCLEEVDVVIVTAIFAFDEIEEEIGDIILAPIVSLEDVVYEL
ncbi:hypothetical protein [Anaerosacchariphilus polymeriproducens]|uniref:D-isomer specific 2-hydroxyacid dehydrogenase NAD-binding domain-containing protein n=1 Tax=Anaerosacchariphilus polymeriproducens TaxID=1812858 RepID=A0A371ATA3_9FIRM|nr:hypothetical protein [Anaerosacchariphilus polymeriproducens]RDU22806.1 hypothetical protein DWV06_12730 [Anaerosacchariphilus polymeriproducens]